MPEVLGIAFPGVGSSASSSFRGAFDGQFIMSDSAFVFEDVNCLSVDMQVPLEASNDVVQGVWRVFHSICLPNFHKIA